jgi:hypothetical protein
MPELVSCSFTLFFAWLFAYSAWHKLRHPYYYDRLLQSWFGGDWIESVGARPVALAELLLALAILLPASRQAGLLLAALALLAYAGLMGWFLVRGRIDLNCGCSGPARDTPISPALVVRNLLCMAMALAVAGSAGQGLLGNGPTLLIATFLCLLYLCCEQLLNNARHPLSENG